MMEARTTGRRKCVYRIGRWERFEHLTVLQPSPVTNLFAPLITTLAPTWN